MSYGQVLAEFTYSLIYIPQYGEAYVYEASGILTTKRTLKIDNIHTNPRFDSEKYKLCGTDFINC